MPKTKKQQLQDLDNQLDKALLLQKTKKEIEADRALMTKLIGQELIELVKPVLESFDKGSQMNKEVMDRLDKTLQEQKQIFREGAAAMAMSLQKVPEAKVNIPNISVPPARVDVDTTKLALVLSEGLKNVKIPPVKVPRPQVNIDMPEAKPMVWPKGAMDVKGSVGITGVSRTQPLPVILRDTKGNPVDLFANLTQVIGGGGGGGAKIVKVSNLPDDYATEGTLSDFNDKFSTETDDGSIAGGVALPYLITLLYGRDGSNWGRIKSSSGAMNTTQRGGSTSQGDAISNTLNSIVNADAQHINLRVMPWMYNGSTWDRLRGTITGGLQTLARPIQVRGSVHTAYASTSTGAETTLKSAVAGKYLDLIQVTGANQSDAAIRIDIRAVSGGNIMTTLEIPANATAGIACTVPIPQDETGNAWTIQIDGSDISNTVIDVTALFSEEV